MYKYKVSTNTNLTINIRSFLWFRNHRTVSRERSSMFCGQLWFIIFNYLFEWIHHNVGKFLFLTCLKIFLHDIVRALSFCASSRVQVYILWSEALLSYWFFKGRRFLCFFSNYGADQLFAMLFHHYQYRVNRVFFSMWVDHSLPHRLDLVDKLSDWGVVRFFEFVLNVLHFASYFDSNFNILSGK